MEPESRPDRVFPRRNGEGHLAKEREWVGMRRCHLAASRGTKIVEPACRTVWEVGGRRKEKAAELEGKCRAVGRQVV